MNYAEQITNNLKNVPDLIAVIVLKDVSQRIGDWLATGGSEEAPYIQQQIDHTKRVSDLFGKKEGSDV